MTLKSTCLHNLYALFQGELRINRDSETRYHLQVICNNASSSDLRATDYINYND